MVALLGRSVTMQAYDLVASAEAKQLLGHHPGILFVDKAMESIQGADALLVVTEWKEFRSPDLPTVAAALKCPVIFSGRKSFEAAQLEAACIEYHGIGRATSASAQARSA